MRPRASKLVIVPVALSLLCAEAKAFEDDTQKCAANWSFRKGTGFIARLKDPSTWQNGINFDNNSFVFSVKPQGSGTSQPIILPDSSGKLTDSEGLFDPPDHYSVYYKGPENGEVTFNMTQVDCSNAFKAMATLSENNICNFDWDK